MVDKTRKVVPYEIGGCYFERDTALEIIEDLKKKIAEYGETLYVDTIYGSYGDSDYLGFYCKRPETDAQYAQRIRTEEEAEQRQRDYDLRQYQALKAKYGDKLD